MEKVILLETAKWGMCQVSRGKKWSVANVADNQVR